MVSECVVQLWIRKYGVHELHSMVPLPLKNRGMPHAGMYIVVVEKKHEN